jgi:CHAT domain-containing protein
LVVLSACDSGLGAKIPGEGLVGLPHAFLRAGAGKVLASLWRVNDPAAPALMSDLYQGLLRDGLTPEAALRRAQLKLAAHPKWRQPYYWAGFVLFGAG